MFQAPPLQVCKCGKKFKQVTSKQTLCRDCAIALKLSKRGKGYQEQVKREAKENG